MQKIVNQMPLGIKKYSMVVGRFIIAIVVEKSLWKNAPMNGMKTHAHIERRNKTPVSRVFGAELVRKAKLFKRHRKP